MQSWLNVIKASFILQTLSAVCLGTLTHLAPAGLSASISKVYRYGKFRYYCAAAAQHDHAVSARLELPKSYFKHVYTFAGPWSTAAALLLCHRYLLDAPPPLPAVSTLELFMAAPLPSLIPAENALLAITLYSLHIWKRCYESHRVSIYSPSNNRMNLTVYLASFYYYFGSVMSIVGESRDLLIPHDDYLYWSRLTWLDHVCVVVFLLSSYAQYRCNLILAALRKDKKGAIVSSTGYKIPRGGLFEYVTAPLQLTEIVLYLCLNAILRDASTFYYVTLLVLANQIEYAYMSHKWSQERFRDYPRDRRVLVPFVF